MAQTLIIHVIRTNPVPFLESWASWPLIVTTASIMALGAWLPLLAHRAGVRLHPIARIVLVPLALTSLGYVLLTRVVKTWFFRKGWVSENDGTTRAG